MADFAHAYEVGRINEGGYVNIASDKGGETYCGISRKYHPLWQGWPIVDAHKPLYRGDFIKDAVMESHIKMFYSANFWRPIKGDDIDSQEVATYLYDWTLTSGGAIKKVQEALGLKGDGIFGNVSLATLNNAGYGFLAALRDIRVKYYEGLVAKDPSQSVNLKGWLNRANGLYDSLSHNS